MSNARPYIGKKLRKFRKEKGISAYRIAKNLHQGEAPLSRYEKGSQGFSNDKLLEILVKGMHIPEQEAEQLAGKWILEEAAQKYGLNITIH